MTNKLWIAVLVASATLTATAHAHGGDRDWRDQGDDHWRHERHHDHWRDHDRHDHHDRRRDGPQWSDAYGYRPDYRSAPSYYEEPRAGIRLPLPPSPWEVHRAIRDTLFGRY